MSATRLLPPLLPILLLAIAGCSRRPESLPAGVTADSIEPRREVRQVPIATAADEGFSPPPREELEQTVTWIDRPVRDALRVLRDELAATPAPVSDAEALATVNTSAADNALILSTLGRLPDEGEADLEARLVRHLRADIATTDPLLRRTPAEFEVLGLTEFGLFSFDRRLEPFANAETVARWQTSSDGLLDRVVLRDDLVWSDGRPITAHDPAFSHRVIVQGAVPERGLRDGAARLRGVHAYDERTVVFFHRERLATNDWDLNFPILPRHVYETGAGSDRPLSAASEDVPFEERPVCGGPYEIVEWARGERIVLRRRDDWSTVAGRRVREVPHFREICFRIIPDPARALEALEEGEIDEMALDPGQWHATGARFDERCVKVTAPEWTSAFFAWNIRSPFFADRRVRRAMTWAFDHGRLLGEICHGLHVAATGPFPDGSWAAPRKRPPTVAQDLARAQQLLDDAGWIDTDADGVRDREIDGRSVPFDFTMLVSDQPIRVAACELLRGNLERIGVRMRVQPMEQALLVDRTQARRFEAWHGGFGAAADPDATASAWTTGGSANLSGYSNPLVDALYEEGRREADRAKRAERYGRIQEILWEDQPCTWLYWRSSLHGFSKDLRGYVFSPRGPSNYSPGIRSLWRPR